MVTTISDTHSSRTTVVYFDLGNTLIFGPPDNRQPFPDAVSTLQTLYDRGYLLGLLSDQVDGTTVVDVAARLAAYGFGDYIEVITISTELPGNVFKPDPAIFDLAIQKAGHSAASTRTIFVTETRGHIYAARNFGWRGILKPYLDSCSSGDGECVATLSDLLYLLPALDVDLYLRDAADDPGVDPYTGSRFWDSPDLWIRNFEDDGTSHQNPEFGQDNWFYANVTNRGDGIARSFSVTFNVTEYAGTQFVFPQNFTPYINSTSDVNLEPGTSRIVKAKWPASSVPEAGTHGCLLSAVYATGDPTPIGRNVWEHNNLAQKNLTVVDLVPGDSVLVPFQLGSRFLLQKERFLIEVHRPHGWIQLPVSIVHSNPEVVRRLIRPFKRIKDASQVRAAEPTPIIRFIEPCRVEISHHGLRTGAVRLNLGRDSTLDVGPEIIRSHAIDDLLNGKSQEADLVTDETASAEISFRPGEFRGFETLMNPRSPVRAGLKVAVPPDSKPGNIIKIDLVQRDRHKHVVGGISIQVNVVAK